MQGEISRKNSWFTKSTGCCYQAIAKIFQHNLIKYCEIKHLRQNHTLNQNFTISTWQQRQWTFLLMTTEHVWIQTGTYISAHPNQISRIHPSSLMQYASPARQMKPVMTIKPAGRTSWCIIISGTWLKSQRLKWQDWQMISIRAVPLVGVWKANSFHYGNTMQWAN